MKIDTINIQTNNGTLFGNVINNYPQQPSSQPAPQPQNIEEAEIVPDVKIPSFFRTNAQSITKIQAKWQEALGNTTKTAVIRFVKATITRQAISNYQAHTNN